MPLAAQFFAKPRVGSGQREDGNQEPQSPLSGCPQRSPPAQSGCLHAEIAVVQKAREAHPEGLGRESGLNRDLPLIACAGMPDDDSGGSTDLSDVFLRAMATPVIRPIAVWMISVAGVLPCLLIHPLSHDAGWVLEDDFWLIVLGPPLSFIGGLQEGLSGVLWVNKHVYAETS